MKKLLSSLFGFLAAYVGLALASWGEFGPQDTLTAKSDVDMTALQYHHVRLTGAGPTMNIASNNAGSSAVGLAAGVLQTNPASQQAGTIAYGGLSKVVAGAATTVNGLMTFNSSGRAIDAVSGSVVTGRFLEAAAADGEKVTALLFPPTRWGSVA